VYSIVHLIFAQRRASAGAGFIGDPLDALVERIISLYVHTLYVHTLDGTKRNGMVVAEIAWVHSVLQFFEVTVDGVFGDVKFVVLRIR
jgi:hypothetical protein